MAKVSTSGGWSHASDAAFRTWLTEYRNMLVSAGLVQTSDTGQIALVTVTFPTVNNTLAGYFIFRFDDTLQSTAPVFMRLTFGRAGAAGILGFGIEVGTGSDGAGNITGTKQSIPPQSTTSGAPGAGTYNSYAIHKEGFAAMVFKLLGTTAAYGVSAGTPNFVVQRTVDNTGAPTADGVHVISSGTNTNGTNSLARAFRLRFLPTTDAGAVHDGNAMGFVPGPTTDSRVGLAPQIFTHWIMLPKQRPLLFTAGSIRSEVSVGNQFSMTLVGTTPRNYLCVGPAVSGVLSGTLIAGASDLHILWED